MKQPIALVLIVTVLVGLMAACAPQAAPSPTPKPEVPTATSPPEPKPSKPVRISMWLMGSGNDADKEFLNQTTAKFKEETGIEVSYQFVAWGDGFKKISTAIAAGEGPDVTQVGTTWVANFQATGAFVDLTDDVGKTLPSADAFTPGAWATSGYGGRVYAIPWFSDIRAQIYRSDLWAEAGYPNGPQTWDEVKEGAKKIKAAHPELESVIGLRGQGFGHFVGSFIWQNCGDFISEDGTKATWNAPQNVEATQWWTNLMVEDGTLSPNNGEWSNDDILARFWEGKIALIYMGPWFTNVATEAQIEKWKDKIAVGPQPRGKNGCRAGFVGGSDLMIFGYSKNKEAAKQWIAFLMRPEIQELNAKLRKYGPAVKAAYDLPELKKGWWPGFFAAAAYGRHFPIHPAWGDMEPLMPKLKSDIYAAVVDGTYTDTTVQELLDAANAEAQEKLDAAGGAPEGYNAKWPQPSQ